MPTYAMLCMKVRTSSVEEYVKSTKEKHERASDAGMSINSLLKSKMQRKKRGEKQILCCGRPWTMYVSFHVFGDWTLALRRWLVV